MFRATPKWKKEVMEMLRETMEPQMVVVYKTSTRQVGFPRKLAEDPIKVDTDRTEAVIEVDDTYIYLWDCNRKAIVETAHIYKLSRTSAMMMIADMLGRNGYSVTHVHKFDR